MLRKIIVALCIFFASGLVLASIYNSMVDAASWSSAMPQSVYTAREYFKTVNPGVYYRLFSPVVQVLSLLLLIVCWKMGSRTRWICLAALLVTVGADLLTFAYFYPRNHIIFTEPVNVDNIIKSVHEWSSMNYVRNGIASIAVLLFFLIQSKIYAATATVKQ